MAISQITYFALLALVGFGRLVELGVSKRNQQRLAEQGASHVPDFSFLWMVLWHGSALAAPAAEVYFLDRPFLLWLAVPMIALFVFANLLRWWVIRALAGHWNVQVIDSTPLGVVSSGPYRWIRHPNYVAVFLELAALALIHTAWLSAIGAAMVTAFVVSRRLAVEERVLLASPAYRAAMGGKPRFIPGLF